MLEILLPVSNGLVASQFKLPVSRNKLFIIILLRYPSIHPFINTHKAAIIKYKNTQNTMNRKKYTKGITFKKMNAYCQ